MHALILRPILVLSLPLFSLAYYFMYDGLCCEGLDPIVHNCVFPHLHAMQQENVAKRMTRAIHQHIVVSALCISHGRKEPNQMFRVKINAQRFHDRESRELGARH